MCELHYYQIKTKKLSRVFLSVYVFKKNCLIFTIISAVKQNGGALIESTGGGASLKASTSNDTRQRQTGQVCCKDIFNSITMLYIKHSISRKHMKS